MRFRLVARRVFLAAALGLALASAVTACSSSSSSAPTSSAPSSSAPASSVLLCLSAALVAAFAWQERRSPNPLLDLRFLRVPQFTTANITAFCTYFATFAIC